MSERRRRPDEGPGHSGAQPGDPASWRPAAGPSAPQGPQGAQGPRPDARQQEPRRGRHAASSAAGPSGRSQALRYPQHTGEQRQARQDAPEPAPLTVATPQGPAMPRAGDERQPWQDAPEPAPLTVATPQGPATPSAADEWLTRQDAPEDSWGQPGEWPQAAQGSGPGEPYYAAQDQDPGGLPAAADGDDWARYTLAPQGADPLLPGLGGERRPGPGEPSPALDQPVGYPRRGGAREPRRKGSQPGPRGPRRRGRSRAAGLLAVALIVVPVTVGLIVGGLFIYRTLSARYSPPDYSGDGTGRVLVQIRPGDNATSVAPRLVSLGIIASARAFVLAAERSNNASSLEPGFFYLHRHMNATAAWNLLLKPSSRDQVKVTIPEGLRLSDIVTVLAGKTGIPVADYERVLRDPASLGLPSYARGNPEGYLFPDTYDIQPKTSAAQVLRMMVQQFDAEAASVNLGSAAARVRLTPAQVITVASLAQAEGGRISDFPKIARVIYNRLRDHMYLDLDSTVLYALHAYGIVASSSDLSVRSPYNTYRYHGLPPGPIDSPGDAAIRAALHPAAGNWLYFVTVNPKTRQTVFTASQAEFNRLRAELEQNLKPGS